MTKKLCSLVKSEWEKCPIGHFLAKTLKLFQKRRNRAKKVNNKTCPFWMSKVAKNKPLIDYYQFLKIFSETLILDHSMFYWLNHVDFQTIKNDKYHFLIFFKLKFFLIHIAKVAIFKSFSVKVALFFWFDAFWATPFF